MTKNYLDKLSIRACCWVLQSLTDTEKGEKAALSEIKAEYKLYKKNARRAVRARRE